MKKLIFMRRVTAIVLIFIILITQGMLNIKFAQDVQETVNSYLTIETTDFEYNNGLTIISGQDRIVSQIEDLNDGILMMMYESENLKIYDQFLNSENEMIDNESIYSKTSASIYCNNVQAANIITAENDININCLKMTSEKNTIIY